VLNVALALKSPNHSTTVYCSLALLWSGLNTGHYNNITLHCASACFRHLYFLRSLASRYVSVGNNDLDTNHNQD